MKVLVTDRERLEIEARARAASMPPSTYLRTVGLGYRLKSTLDQQQIGTLAKLNADQGRLGGLLKLWISSRPGDGAPVFDVRKLLRQIEETQKRLKAVLERL